jgi:hypothetical protein
METPQNVASLEEQIEQWRSFLRRRQAIHTVDVAELEDHLREQVAGLVAAGLATDEAFLIAVKRMGALDALSREFAREHSERLWKQLVTVPPVSGETREVGRTDAIAAFVFAVMAAMAVKAPMLFGIRMEANETFYIHNLCLFVLPFLTGYFVWKRRLEAKTFIPLAVAFVVAGVFANVYPVKPNGSTEALAVAHMPIALWLAVGIAYAGGRWGQVDGRMDFIRFSGELAIYFALMAAGGGVIAGLTRLTFEAVGINALHFIQQWLLPCGAVGAVLVGSWLVEAKQSVIENMAPVLTRLFTPLFTAVLVVFLGTVLWTGNAIDIKRDVLIAFDLVLALVVGLLLYSISARDRQVPPGVFDWVQVTLVICALVVDAIALWAIAARINEFGFTPNRVAALGENLILLVNLAWSAVLYLRFLRGRGTFGALEKWQTDYVPVYSVWAALVVIVFPPLFRYL